MIGFTFAAMIYDEDGDPMWATVLATLDTDGDDKPMVDLRLKDGDGSEYIATVDVDDLYDTVCEIRCQREQWKRDQVAKEAAS